MIPTREEIAHAIDPHAWDYKSEHRLNLIMAKRKDVSLNQADNVLKLIREKLTGEHDYDDAVRAWLNKGR